MLTSAHWIVLAATAAVAVSCVLIHYEGLRFLSNRAGVVKLDQRRHVVILILCLLLLHIIEVWVFGGAYILLLDLGDYGELHASTPVSPFDCIYFSATVFTTLGFGDITPTGPIRAMTGTEAIVGLTLITWSASDTFVEMPKTWNNDER